MKRIQWAACASLVLALSPPGASRSANAGPDPSPPPAAARQAPEPRQFPVEQAQPRSTHIESFYACPHCNLRGVDLSGRNLTNANLQGAVLSNARLRGTNLAGAELAGADLSGADLTDAILTASDRGNADLSSSNLSAAILTGAQLAGTDLEYANLAGADFSRTDLSLARLGPAPRTGISGGRRTSFRHAVLPARLVLSPETSDSSHATRAQPSPAAVTAGAFGVSCGASDLGGLVRAVHVAPSGKDGAECGTSLETACATLAQGLRTCSGSSCGVLVGYGEYPQASPLALRDGVSIYGGCVAAGQNSAGLLSLIKAPANGAPAVTATAITSATRIENLKISGSPATAPGTPSVALQISNSSGLHIANAEVYAGPGAAGASGAAPGVAGRGGAGSGRTAGTNAACSGSSGGAGSIKMAVSVDVGAVTYSCNATCSDNSCYGYDAQPGTTGTWARGGQWGEPNCTECPRSSGKTGNSGAAGTTASCGSRGIVTADTRGRFNGTTWLAGQGGNGTPGGNGGGGAGGGAGGYKAGACFWVKTQDDGNTGGGGGAGGCGGGPGGGGQQGGGSFALVNAGSRLDISSSRLVGGLGGTGGRGADGATGAIGGDGAGGASGGGGGTGGTGGKGGAGGGGGGGAGGNGGPSVAAALVGNATLVGSRLVFYSGSGGGGGGGGTGAASGVAACTAGNGDGGAVGLAVDQQQF